MNRLIKKALCFLTAFCCLAGGAAAANASYNGNDWKHKEVLRAVFENAQNDAPDLFVTKEVVSPSEGRQAPSDARFTFTLLLDHKPAKETTYRVFDKKNNNQEIFLYADGESAEKKPNRLPWRTDRNGEFSLKDGQTAKFEYVGSGVAYEVREKPAEGFFQTEPPGGLPAVGTVPGKGAAVNFVNTWQPETEGELGSIRVSKAISFPKGYRAPETPDFSFRLTIGGRPFGKEAYTVVNGNGETVGVGTTGMDGSFTLKAGETAVFEKLETSQDYQVKEETTDGWRIVGKGTVEGAVSAPAVQVNFTNASASFAVTKKMEDNSRPDREFTFLLTDANKKVWAGASYLLYDTAGNQIPETDAQGAPVLEDGKPVYLTGATDSAGNFRLKPGQTAVFTGIEPGTVYNVSEVSDPAYIQILPQTADGYTNKTVSDAVELLTFINKQAPASLTVTKRIKNSGEEAPLEQKEFTFVLRRRDPETGGYEPLPKAVYTVSSGTTEKTYETDGDGRFTLKANETARFDRLPDGVYQAEEIEIPLGYVPEKAVLEGELSDENRNPELIFTNTYTDLNFDLYLTKEADGRQGTPLAGAKFMLYRDELEQNPVQKTPYVTGEDGGIQIEKLKTGTYFLKETEAPEGYQLLVSPIRLEVTWEAKKDTQGQTIGHEMKVSVDDKTITSGEKDKQIHIVQKGTDAGDRNEVHIKIYNSRRFILPITGGRGTAAAAAAMIGAAAVLVLLGGYKNRKRSGR